jgi:Protein of unknown function (DUF2628)
MAVYTVHEPPLRRRESESDPTRFAFVRDGFHFWAFVLSSLWMLRHRMWLVLIAHLLVVTALAVALSWFDAPGNAIVMVGALLALLIGLEASTLRRFTLGRRGWKYVGVVVADDLELAERRFFDSWTGHAAPPSTASSSLPPAAPPSRAAGSAQQDVIGLFPQPGTQP